MNHIRKRDIEEEGTHLPTERKESDSHMPTTLPVKQNKIAIKAKISGQKWEETYL